ncbi:hypothetical protein [Chamaesiphon sp.]
MTISTQYPIISTRYPTMAIGGAEDKVNGCDILARLYPFSIALDLSPSP